MQDSEFSSKIRRAVAGDRGAQEVLFINCRPLVRLVRLVIRRQIREIFPSRFDESDIVQQTCLEAFGAFSSFKGRSCGEFLKWLQ
ncbi:MAG: hypothetical protein WBH50_16115, partial [Fuerstiella sp.]